MAIFLGWGLNKDNEFGANISVAPRVHVVGADGTVEARELHDKAKINHFTQAQINERAAMGGSASTQGFWKATADALPAAQAMYENKMDLTEAVSPKFGREPELAVNMKPVMPG